MADGEVAYGIYRRAMAEQGVECAPWSEIDDEGRVAWQAVADQLWQTTE